MTLTLAAIIIVFAFGLVLVAGLLWEYFSETYDDVEPFHTVVDETKKRP